MFGNLFKKYSNLNVVELVILFFMVSCLLCFISQSFFRMSDIKAAKRQIKDMGIICSIAGGEIKKIYFNYLLGITEDKQRDVITFHIVGNKHKFPLTVYYNRDGNSVNILQCNLPEKIIYLSSNNSCIVMDKLDEMTYFTLITKWLIYSFVIAILLFTAITQEKWERHIKKYHLSKIYFYLKNRMKKLKLTVNLYFWVYSILLIYFLLIAITNLLYWVV